MSTGWKGITTQKSWGSVKLPLMLALHLFMEVPGIHISFQKLEELPCLLQLLSALWLLLSSEKTQFSHPQLLYSSLPLPQLLSSIFHACVLCSFFTTENCDSLLPPSLFECCCASWWPQIFPSVLISCADPSLLLYLLHAGIMTWGLNSSAGIRPWPRVSAECSRS